MKKNLPRKNYLTLNIKSALSFYDELSDQGKNPFGSSVSALTGLIGEDLVLGALDNYFGGKVTKEIDYSCKGVVSMVRRRGKKSKKTNSWLDAWIKLPDRCYQTEVKNWSASAVGGKPVSKDGLVSAAHHNMRVYLEEDRNTTKVWKVLKKMRGAPMKRVEPLLAFWSPLAPESIKKEDKLRPLFRQSINPYLRKIMAAKIAPAGFESVTIFSASLHLRNLERRGKNTVTLYMPRAAQRLSQLRQLGIKLS
jgi:hypothetical protein